MANQPTTQVLEEIGRRARQRRRELDLTQEKVADLASLSKSFISEVEGGTTSASGLHYLRIAQVLEVDVQWLLTGKGAPEPESASGPRITPLLSEVADEEGWSYKQTLDVAAALSAIVARRSQGGQPWQPSRDYILRVARAIRDE